MVTPGILRDVPGTTYIDRNTDGREKAVKRRSTEVKFCQTGADAGSRETVRKIPTFAAKNAAKNGWHPVGSTDLTILYPR
jgi:hypothetical protein